MSDTSSDSDFEADQAQARPRRESLAQEEGAPDEASAEQGNTRKRQKQEWTTLRRWNKDEVTQEEIDRQVAELARQELHPYLDISGLKLSTNNLEGWAWKGTDKGRFNSTSIVRYACPGKYRFGCKCIMNVVESASATEIIVANRHDANSHNDDKSKYLKVEQLAAVARQVKSNPTLAPLQIRRAVQNASPTKAIDAKHKHSLRRKVTQQRNQVSSAIFGEVVFNSTYGSLEQFAVALFFPTILQR